MRQAIREQAEPMLEPPIRNIGVKGIRKAAQMVPKWPEKLDADELRFALFNAYIFISPVGGTGGGCFRYMFSRFLREAAEITGRPASGGERRASSSTSATSGRSWASGSARPPRRPTPPRCGRVRRPAGALADLEEAAWTRLRDIVSD